MPERESASLPFRVLLLFIQDIIFMSLLLSRLSHGSVRSSLLLILSSGFSSSSLLQTSPCRIIGASPCGEGLGKLILIEANKFDCTRLEKKVPLELVYNNYYEESKTVTIGASHGWVATLKGDGILRLQDDLNPYASDTNPKCIPLPPLETLPRCQTQIVTNVSMSSSSPEDEDCVVAVKFLGPQLSFCRPGGRFAEWINIRTDNPCFYNSRVVYSKKDDMFRLLGSGGHLIGSWDLHTHHQPTTMLEMLRFKKLPELNITKQEFLDSCFTSEFLVESESTGETFLVKLYKKTAEIEDGTSKMKTEHIMVFKLDEKGNAVYTQDIGDLCIFLSQSEPFAVPATQFPGMRPNVVDIFDSDELAYFSIRTSSVSGLPRTLGTNPYHIPPQFIV